MAINKSMLLVGTILAAGLAPGLAGTALAQATASPFTSAQRFDTAGRVTGTISPDPDGTGPLLHRATRNSYDAAGRLTRVETGTLSSWKSEDVEPLDWTGFTIAQTLNVTYDAMNRKVKESVSSGGTIQALAQYSYDAVGRLECSAVRMNPAIFATIATAACTLGTQGTGANAFGPDRITRNVYNAAGQVTQVRRGVGSADQVNETTNTYTLNGRLATLTDATGNRTTFEYDGHDRLSKTRFPSPSTDGVSSTTDYEQLTYESLAGGTRTSDLVASRRLRDGQAIASTYDTLGRVTLKNLPGAEPDVSYTYDLMGRMLSATRTGHALTFTYDALGRNLTQVGPLGTMSSQYDSGGRRTRLTYAGTGLYVDYDYLVTGEVTKIRENGATTGAGVLATYTYDSLGRRTAIARGNGTSASYSYDGVSRMTQLAENLAGTTSDLTLGFSYNPASQITSDVRSNDAFSVTPTLSSRTDTHNGLNQVTAIGAMAVSHTDARGNVTAIGTAAYGYSAENRLTAAPGSVTLAYDPMLRLYQTLGGGVTTRFAYDGTNMIAEYNGSNVLQRRFVHGSGVDEPLVWYEGTGSATRRWFHADERGSVIAVSDGAGNLHGTLNRYDEYGAAQGTLTGRFGFTGQAWIPEAGLYYYKARMYNPAIGGRFMQIDPLLYVDGPNPYIYAHNDPVNATDPTGTQTVDDMQLQAQIEDLRQQGYTEAEIREYVGEQAQMQAAALLAMVPIEGLIVRGLGFAGRMLGIGVRGASVASERLFFRSLSELFTRGAPPTASRVEQWARRQGFTRSQTRGGPVKYTDRNGVVRVTIKKGSDRAPGSNRPHGEFRDAQGRRIDPITGQPVTRRSPENHTPIR